MQYSGQFPTTVVSRLAEELFFFGKLGVVTGAQLTVGDQSVKLPTSAAEVLLAARKLLRKDGKLIVHTPNLSYWLERLKDWGVIRQIYGHIAVRNEAQYLQALTQAGFGQCDVIGLAHYRQPLRSVDLLLRRIPLLGRLFRARLFIVARAAP